jgi:hypothetical protein
MMNFRFSRILVITTPKWLKECSVICYLMIIITCLSRAIMSVYLPSSKPYRINYFQSTAGILSYCSIWISLNKPRQFHFMNTMILLWTWKDTKNYLIKAINTVLFSMNLIVYLWKCSKLKKRKYWIRKLLIKILILMTKSMPINTNMERW